MTDRRLILSCLHGYVRSGGGDTRGPGVHLMHLGVGSRGDARRNSVRV